MNKKNIIQTISEKEMDRKEFLKYSGLALLGLVGFKSVATLLTKMDNVQVITEKHSNSSGFGSGKYGA